MKILICLALLFSLFNVDAFALPAPIQPNEAANLHTWLDVDAGLAPGSIPEWSDRSGLNHDAVQADSSHQLTYVADVVYGHGVVRNDGSNQWLGIPAALPDEATVFQVFKSSAITNQGIFSTSIDINHPNDASTLLLLSDFSGDMKLYSSGYYDGGSFSENEFHLAVFTTSVAAADTDHPYGKINLWLDNVHVVTDQPRGNGENSAMIIGYGYQGPFNGDLGDTVVVGSSTMPSGEFQGVSAYEGQKFGVAMAQ